MLTLSAERRLLRKQRSQERKQLKKRMDGYNSLARASKGEPLRYSERSAYTVADISEELYAEIHRENVRPHKKGRGLGVVQDVVCQEVREMWHAKIGLVASLSDRNREELRTMSVSSMLRETRLSNLARWMVEQYCDVEGYDPEKHLSCFSSEEMSR